jgi:hypothetical protein
MASKGEPMPHRPRFARLGVAAPLACALTAASGGARADEQTRTLESPRFLGRGGTYVAGYDSDDASRGNPATLAEPALKFQLRWLQLDAMAGQNAIDSLGDVLEASGEKSAIDVLDTFTDKFGKRQYLRGQASPLAFRVFSFELAPFVSTTNFVDMRVPSLPEVTFSSDTLSGVSLTKAFAIGQTLLVGLTLTPGYRTTYAGEVTFADLLDFVDSDDQELSDLFDERSGMQLGWNAGAIWKPSKEWRFGLLAENVGYTAGIGDADAPPRPSPMRLSTGLSYRIDWKPWAWDWMLDVQDVVNPQQYDYWRLIHLGTELGRTYVSRDNDVGLQLGVNEGYLTAGAFVDAFIARLNLAYYAVELGEYAGQRPDRRWGVTLVSTTTF